MTDDTASSLVRVTYGAREGSTMILEADNMSVRRSADGKGRVVELFRYHAKSGKPLESYQWHIGEEDWERLKRS